MVNSLTNALTNSTTNSTTNSWTFLGPGNIGGRTRALLFHPGDPRILFAAGVSGGVWKSVDGGARWSPIGDALTNIAVNALVIDKKNPDVLYAGTGEGYFREDVRGTALPLRGNGVFVTRDGGVSWQQLPSTGNDDFLWVNDLVMSAHDPARIYAATRSGVWRTNDAGASWTRVVATSVKGGCLDLALRPSSAGDYLFASCGVFEQATVYRNPRAEGSEAWSAVLDEPGMSRTTLAIAPSNPSVVYALAASNIPGPAGTTQNLLALFRSDANGDRGTWEARTRFDFENDPLGSVLLSNPITALSPSCGGSPDSGDWVPMGWHCNVIAVDPVNADRVWAGGVDLFRSDDGGRSWGVGSYWWLNAPSFVHADQHVIAFHPQYDGVTNRTMYAANDGGVFVTENALAEVASSFTGACVPSSGMRWTALNHGYGVTQFYHGAVFPDGRRFLGGAQDNGTLIGSIETGSDAWTRAYGGDGGYVVVDPVDPSNVYAESQYAFLARSQNGGAAFRSLGQPGRDEFLFIAPLALDPNDHLRLWSGGSKLWRSDDQATRWQQASQTFEGRVSAIAVDSSSSDHVIAGMNDGTIAVTRAATSASLNSIWTTVKPRAGFVSSITFDPLHPAVVYATYAGFGGGAHLWRSLDGGASWIAFDNGLPDMPLHSLAIDPTRAGRLYLGTDLGVLVSIDGGATWLVEETGFPAAITEALTIAPGPRGLALYAFTHGRGAWRADLSVTTRRRPGR
jgi:photosystem II stability/assembly factor-like uncharacterized protein